MDRDYWTDMEYRLEGELRSFFWKEVGQLYAEAMNEGSTKDFRSRLDSLIAGHEELLGITAARLADTANKDGDDD